MKATLFIGPFSSKCGECGLGAAWREETHDTVLGYYPEDKERPKGCGVRWTHVSFNYTGRALEAAKACRPDLRWDNV